MVTEIAEIEIEPGKEAQFIAGVESSRPAFLRAPGCHGFELHHSIEHPQQFILLVEWESVADHLAFRNAPAFAIWREAVGGCFAGSPRVQHTTKLLG